MPVLPVAHGVTVPLPLEPDIERIRHLAQTPVTLSSHAAVTATSCGSPLDAALTLRLATLPLTTQQFSNCSDAAFTELTAGPWWVRLVLGHDVVYYVFPVMLLIGLVCDVIGAIVLFTLVCNSRRSVTSSRSNGCRGGTSAAAAAAAAPAARGRRQGNVYLLWNVITGAALLICCCIRRMSDYVDLDTGGFIGSGLNVYVNSIDEWLSYASLWLLVAMDLEKALQLTSSESAGEQRPSPLLTSKSAFVVNNGIKHHGGPTGKSSIKSSTALSSLYRKEVAVCGAVYAVCLVSALPHFFSFQVIETLDLATNRTVFVPRHSDELVDSFEFRVVYYWYVVGLTVLIPLPVLVVVSVVICRALLSRRRRLKRKRMPAPPPIQQQGGNCDGATVVMVGKSIMARKSASSSSASGGGGGGGGGGNCKGVVDADAVALSGRLLVVSTALYVLFTAPRTALTCLEGLPSSRWSMLSSDFDGSGPSSAEKLDGESSIVGDMINSLAEFSFYLYYASSLPLLCSYHDGFHARLARFVCCCMRSKRCQKTRQYKHAGKSAAVKFHGQTQVHRPAAKKTVKFDSRTIEIEIQC
jgi:heme exporter protein D